MALKESVNGNWSNATEKAPSVLLNGLIDVDIFMVLKKIQWRETLIIPKRHGLRKGLSVRIRTCYIQVDFDNTFISSR